MLNTKRQIQVQELELELELELKKGNSGTQPGALAPVHNSNCSRFDSDHHAHYYVTYIFHDGHGGRVWRALGRARPSTKCQRLDLT